MLRTNHPLPFGTSPCSVLSGFDSGTMNSKPAVTAVCDAEETVRWAASHRSFHLSAFALNEGLAGCLASHPEKGGRDATSRLDRHCTPPNGCLCSWTHFRRDRRDCADAYQLHGQSLSRVLGRHDARLALGRYA